MNKRTFVKAIGYSTICQRTWEVFCSLMYYLKGVQTLVIAVDHAMAYEPALAPLSSGLGGPVEHYFR